MEPKLSIQAFHQCPSLVTIKFSNSNYIFWRSQILPLIRSLSVKHHIEDDDKPNQRIEEENGRPTIDPKYANWINNDGLMMS